MLYRYFEVISKYKSNYYLEKAIKEKKIYKVKDGLYSDNKYFDYLEIINKKYPKAIFTQDSAYYYHNLSDVIPDKYYLATHRKAAKINDCEVKQIYVPEDKLNIGITRIKVNGIEIKIYDKERLLIELIKNNKKIPLDYYSEIIHNYREIVDDLDINKLSNYLKYYKKQEELFMTIQKEVF